MADIVVHRCTVRVVRSTGWSWGPEPRRLVQNVLKAVPSLVAEKLASFLPDDAAGDVGSLKIRLSVSRADLIGDIADGSRPDTPSRFTHQLDEEIAKEMESLLSGLAAAPQAEAGQPVEFAKAEAPPPGLQTILQPLLHWAETGNLARVVSRLEPELAESWLRRLSPFAGLAAGRKTASRETEAAVRRHTERLTAGGIRLERNQRMLILVAEVFRELHVLPSFEDLPSDAGMGVDEMEALPAGRTREETRTGEPDAGAHEHQRMEGTAEAPELRARRPEAAQQPAPRLGEEIAVSSAVPWLLLGPLHKTGYLDTLRVALELADLRDTAGYFAAVLALKVAQPPRLAWQHTPETETMAAAFAGLPRPVSKPGMGDFARKIAPSLPVLDADLAESVLGGRRAGSPLLLHAWPDSADGRFLLLDPEGLFPAGYFAEVNRISDLLPEDSDCRMVVPASLATPGFLASLHSAGMFFLTLGPPVRGEAWPRIATPGFNHWWTNGAVRLNGAERSALRDYDHVVPRAEEMIAELALRRRALPLSDGSPLESSAMLAAGVALGTIAWTLWRKLESTDPLLALARFEDLSARIRFGRRSVQVVLPLGKRHRDLYENDLLGGVPDVPWLDGRAVEFSGG